MNVNISKYNVDAFAVGARGFISRENRTRLKKIHKLFRKDIKLRDNEENIGRLAILYLSMQRSNRMGNSAHVDYLN